MNLETIRKELEMLRIKLAETEETLSAIQNGGVDALIINQPEGSQIFTLQSADYPYRMIIENMSEATVTLSEVMDIIYCNRRLKEMLEIPFEELINKPIELIVHPDDFSELRQICTLKEKNSLNAEIRLIGKNGKITPVLASCFPLLLEEPFICVILTDLTEIKQVQNELKHLNDKLDDLVMQRTAQLLQANLALQENQAILKTIIESTPDWIAMKKMDGRYFMVNSAVTKALFPENLSEAEKKDLTIDDLVTPEEAAIIKEKETVALEKKMPVKYDQDFTLKGNQRTFSTIKSPCLNDSGELIGIATISRDITERKLAENALRESEERLRALIKATSDLVFRADPEFNQIYHIESWGAYSRIETTIQNWFQMIPPQSQSEIRQTIQKAIQNKSIIEIEHPIMMGEKAAWMFTRAIPILNERQEIVEWFGTSGDITSRKAAEEYLRESEKRYSALFENKLNGILHARILTDAQNNPVDILYLDINEAYEKIIGLKSEQIKGKTVKEIFHGKIPISEKIDIYSRVALKNQEVRYEEYFEPAQRYLQIYAYCPKYGEFIAIFSDITERKIAEKALAESEKKFSIMFQTIPVGIILTTFEEGLIYDVNAGWLSLMGFSKKEEVLGKTTPELGLIPLAQQREFILKEFKQNGKVRNSEQTIRDRKGGLHQVIVNVDAIEIEDRKFILSTLEDITDRKSMEDALRESQQKWVTTLSSIGDAVISTDTEGIVTFMNPEAERLTGWNHREILRKPIDQVLTILDNVTSLPVDYQLFSNIQVAGLSESKILLHRSGQKIPVDYNVAPIRTKEGRNQGIIVIFKDISKRKEAEEVVKNYSLHLENMVRERTAELETAKERAESADKLKTAFLLNMSHELRTPLNSIIGFSSILLKQLAGPLNEEQQKQLNMVQKSGRHLLSLINDILDISRIEAGELNPLIESFDLPELLQEVLKSVEPLILSKGLQLTFDSLSGMPPLESDKLRVRQVLINIIYNAVKFTDHGRISIKCYQEEQWIKIEISDTGIGIKKEDLDKLFNPFIQLENNLTRRFEGSGLGLSISKKIMDMLKGTILVSSVYNAGTTFTLIFPLRFTLTI